MREHETSAPSLGDEDLIERACEASWAVARPYIAEHFRAGMDPGEYESQLAEDKAITRLEIAAVLDLFRSTAMAEAVASARAEGVREALEVCKKLTPPEDAYHSGRIWDEHRAAVGEVEEAIRALIPGGSSDV